MPERRSTESRREHCLREPAESVLLPALPGELIDVQRAAHYEYCVSTITPAARCIAALISTQPDMRLVAEATSGWRL